MTHITEDFFSVRIDETHETDTLNAVCTAPVYFMVTLGMRGNDASLFLPLDFLYVFAQTMGEGDSVRARDSYDNRYILDWDSDISTLSIIDERGFGAVVESLTCRTIAERDFIIESLVNEAQAHDFS